MTIKINHLQFYIRWQSAQKKLMCFFFLKSRFSYISLYIKHDISTYNTRSQLIMRDLYLLLEISSYNIPIPSGLMICYL